MHRDAARRGGAARAGASGTDNPYGRYNSDLTRWGGGDPIRYPLSDSCKMTILHGTVLNFIACSSQNFASDRHAGSRARMDGRARGRTRRTRARDVDGQASELALVQIRAARRTQERAAVTGGCILLCTCQLKRRRPAVMCRCGARPQWCSP